MREYAHMFAIICGYAHWCASAKYGAYPSPAKTPVSSKPLWQVFFYKKKNFGKFCKFLGLPNIVLPNTPSLPNIFMLSLIIPVPDIMSDCHHRGLWANSLEQISLSLSWSKYAANNKENCGFPEARPLGIIAKQSWRRVSFPNGLKKIDPQQRGVWSLAANCRFPEIIEQNLQTGWEDVVWNFSENSSILVTECFPFYPASRSTPGSCKVWVTIKSSGLKIVISRQLYLSYIHDQQFVAIKPNCKDSTHDVKWMTDNNNFNSIFVDK